MTSYGYNVKNIKTLSDINSNSSFWYEYKNLNFLSKLKTTNTNLVVLFHGCIAQKTSNVFRGFDYVFENTDVVCVSNTLTNIYTELQISWYLSSKKYDVTGICHELFSFLMDAKKYKNVIFTGSSAGAYPSIYYASIFNKIAIIGNPQIYLELDGRYKNAQTLLKQNDDELIYTDKEIEQVIHNNKPKKIILYQNLLDRDLYSTFVKFMNNQYSDIFEFIPFNGPSVLELGKSQHSFMFPDSKGNWIIIKEHLKFLSGS